MNKTETKILSEQSKEIIDNFFLSEGKKEKTFNSRKKFEKLLIQKEKYENRLWSEDITIINHILSNKNFIESKSRIKEIERVSNDWNTPNDEGEHCLFFLLKKNFKIKEIKSLIEQHKINFFQKNKQNLFFINYFLNNEPIEKIIDDYEKGKNNFPEIRLNKYFEEYLEIIDLFPELFKETASFEKEKFDHIKEILTTEKIKKFNNNKIGIVVEETMNKIEKTLLYLSFDNQFSNKNLKEKKLKI